MLEKKFLQLAGVTPTAEVNQALHEDLATADAMFMKILLGHWVVATTIMGFGYGYYLMGFIGGGIICGLAYLAHRFLTNTVYSHAMMGAGLMLFSALFIQQNLGRIEIHFHIFAALALLIRYKSLAPLLGAVVTTAVHHVAFNLCQTYGVEMFGTPVRVFNYGEGIGIVALHATFALSEAIFIGLIITQITKQYCDSVQLSTNTLEVVETLNTVIQTGDTSQRVADDNEHAHVVNDLLKLMNSQVATYEAVQRASTSLLLVNPEGEIIDANQAAKSLFASVQQDFAADQINLAPELLGSSIHPLYSPSGVRIDIASFSQTETHEFKVGNATLKLTATPITNKHGQRVGAIFEWENRTQEVEVEHEVQAIVDSARLGDLTRRIETAGKTGFFGSLSRGMNELLDEMARVIDSTVEVLGAISRGDLRKSLEGEYHGQFAELQSDINATINALAKVADEILRGSNSVAEGVAKLAQNNADLSSRTEQQAASLEETAASMEEMTATVSQTASSAAKANELAGDARDQAERGGRVVSEAVDAMEGINKSSEKIVEIISVIDEIAFQTNLLALNASVEAARAGEQGRGFSVVAQEVRSLAGRCATAAQEIKELIEDSANRVKSGTKLVNDSGETLNEIVNSIRKVNTIVAEMASAAEEQAAGIDEVGKAVTQMDLMTQQNASMAEQSAEASSAMGQDARMLKETVKFFKVS